MAIVVEQEQRGMPFFTIAVGIVILSVVGAATYFLFFAEVPLIEMVAPVQFQSTGNLSKINVGPAAVLEDPTFQALKSYVADPSPGPVGRANPFLGF